MFVFSEGFNDTFDLKRHTRTHTGKFISICNRQNNYWLESYHQQVSDLIDAIYVTSHLRNGVR